MTKLLQINVTANAASTGRLAEDIGDVAIANGWQSYIAYGRDYRPSHSQLIKIGGRLSIYSHVLVSSLFDRHGLGSYFATKRFLKKVDEIKPDIIQFHNVHGYFLNLPLVLNYCKDKNIPLVWSLHDCWSMTGHCSHFAMEGCEKWKTECNHCSLLKKYPASFGLIDNSRSNYRIKKQLVEALPSLTIISGSQWLGDIAKQSYFKNRKVKVIPHGIDTEIYQPRTNGNEIRKRLGLEGKFVIMASGTVWLAYKGLYDFEKLQRILPDDCQIIIVGMSQEEIEKKLPKGLIGIPRTKTPQELSEYYSMADCVMSLSRLESFGLTPVEGFACGTPAIVYNDTSLPELITEETGFIAEPGNIEDVKEKVLKLKAIGKDHYTVNCRKVAVEKYDRYKCYEEYLRVYGELIK